MSKFKIFSLILLVTALVGWYYFKYQYPFHEFSRLSEILFPSGTKILKWEDSFPMLIGSFKIPDDKLAQFVADNNLSDGGYVGSDVWIGGRCIHDGNHSVDMKLNKQTGVLELMVGYPDFAGDKPCVP